MFLKPLDASKVLSYKALGCFYLRKSDSLFALKTVCLELKGLLFTYRDAFDVVGHSLKDTFRAMA